MFSMKPHETGEWFEVGAVITDPTKNDEPADVTGKQVSLVVRKGQKATDPVVAVDGVSTWVVDGTTGTVAAGGRIALVGKFYGSLIVGTPSDGEGWPVIEMFALPIVDHP